MATTTDYNSHYQTSAYGRGTTKAVKVTPEAKAMSAVAWVLQVLVGAFFLYAGAMKLGGNAQMVQLFDAIGFGQWLRYVTGTIEFVSAILLFTPQTAAVGAALLACTMVGALLTHAFIIGGDPTRAIVCLVLALAIVALRWRRAREMIKQENVVNV